MNTSYSKIIRIIAAAKKINQKELAKLSGVDQSYISLIYREKRIPSLKTYQRLCDGLGISMATLAMLNHSKEEFEQLKKRYQREILLEFKRILLDE